MKEHPILFNTEMVKAVLDGRKTQTRRVIKPQPYFSRGNIYRFEPKKGININLTDHPDLALKYCPYGQIGDRLWVRETFKGYHRRGILPPKFFYKASDPDVWPHLKWTPSIHMPRAASRITFEIVNIRIERVQDITHLGALEEGIERSDWEYSCEPYRNYNEPRMAPGKNCSSARTSFYTLWNSINAKRGFGWDVNPLVWVVEFKRI